jgi:hypothetical protein
MANTFYMKREKEGKLIQLLVVKETYGDFGLMTEKVKYDIDPSYKTKFHFMKYPIPQEELFEIGEEEFRQLVLLHLSGAPKLTPPPTQISYDQNP